MHGVPKPAFDSDGQLTSISRTLRQHYHRLAPAMMAALISVLIPPNTIISAGVHAQAHF